MQDNPNDQIRIPAPQPLLQLSANTRVAVARKRAVERAEDALSVRKNELQLALEILTPDELESYYAAVERRRVPR